MPECKDVGTLKALQQIHACLFGELYDFAGKTRTKTIAKGNTLFCLEEHFHSYLKTIETMPEKLSSSKITQLILRK